MSGKKIGTIEMTGVITTARNVENLDKIHKIVKDISIHYKPLYFIKKNKSHHLILLQIHTINKPFIIARKYENIRFRINSISNH